MEEFSDETVAFKLITFPESIEESLSKVLTGQKWVLIVKCDHLRCVEDNYKKRLEHLTG